MTAEKRPKAKPPKSGHEQQQEDRTAEATSEPADELKWHERATFEVVFEQATDASAGALWRTCGYHEETDNRATWPGIAAEPLLRWMRERADLLEQAEAQPEAVASPASSEPSENAEVPDLRIRIGELELAEALIEQQVGGAEVSRQINAQAHFELESDEAQLESVGAASYNFELRACDQVSEQSLILASVWGMLEPGKRDYSEAVTFDFPPVGDYQLLTTVILPEQQVASTAVGPVLHVVP